MGAMLVKIESSEEQDFIKMKYITSNMNVWIGLTDSANEGNWKWTDGTAPGYTNWMSGQPNNYWGQDCGEIRKGNYHGTNYNGQWQDLDCSGPSTGFICELR